MVYDVARVRGLYPSLGDGWTYLNADYRPQTPESVASAVARAFRASYVMEPLEAGGSGAHSLGQAPGLAGEGFEASARRAVADLTGTSAEAVIFGPSLEVLMQRLSVALVPLLRRGSAVISSRADAHRITCPAHVEHVVAEPDLGTGEVPAWQFQELVTGATRLVSVSAAHRHVGTINDVARMSEIVHERSRAWLLVDSSSLVGVRPIDHETLGADIVALDLGAAGGPDVAALSFRDARMFPRIDAASLATPVSRALLGGVPEFVEHLADLVEQHRGTRSTRLDRSVAQAGSYQESLSSYLVDSLSVLPSVHLFGVSGEAAGDAPVDRLPRATFCVDGVPARTVHERLLSNRLVTSIAASDPLLDAMGLPDTTGAVSIGLGPYNTPGDVDQLARVLASLA